MLEQPAGSAFLLGLQAALQHGDVLEVHASACMFGAPENKRFRLLAHRLPALALDRRCSGLHSHLPGPMKRGGATSQPGFADAIAQVFSRGLHRLLGQRASVDLDVYGLEAPLINDLASASDWQVLSAWKWRLESEAYLRLCLRKDRLCQPCRFSSLIDSNVARCALSKGRSPSLALTRVLKRVSAISLSSELYGALPSCPTRLMHADNPSRGSDPDPPVPGPSLLEAYDLASLAALHRLRPRIGPGLSFGLPLGFLPATRTAYVPPSFDFDSSLAFPGEGPLLCVGFHFWGLFQGFVLVCLLGPSYGMLEPRSAGDAARLQARRNRPLSVGRPVERVTQKNRDRLWESFAEWLGDQGVPLMSYAF